jgi:hypothetical protein
LEKINSYDKSDKNKKSKIENKKSKIEYKPILEEKEIEYYDIKDNVEKTRGFDKHILENKSKSKIEIKESEKVKKTSKRSEYKNTFNN